MYKFLSLDWIKAYQDEWSKNNKLIENLKNFTANIKYYIDGNESEAVTL